MRTNGPKLACMAGKMVYSSLSLVYSVLPNDKNTFEQHV